MLLFVQIAFCSFLMIASQSCSATASDIDRLFDLPEKKIDVGIAALILAKELHPDLDIPAYSKKIDILALKAVQLGKGTTDPEQRIRVLNTLLYQIEGFHYDHSESAQMKVENQTLKGLLDTKMGTCDTLPILYLAVAQRLGYPVYPVSAPDHQFLRYIDPHLKMQNIEATSGGGYSPDETYIREFHVNEKALKSGSYMRTMTYREYLGFMLDDISIALARKDGNIDRSIRYFEKVAKIYPTYPDVYISLKRAYIARSQQVDPDMAEIYRLKAFNYAAKADALGYFKLPPFIPASAGENK